MLASRGRTIVEWSPHNPQRLALVSGSVLLYDVDGPQFQLPHPYPLGDVRGERRTGNARNSSIGISEYEREKVVGKNRLDGGTQTEQRSVSMDLNAQGSGVGSPNLSMAYLTLPGVAVPHFYSSYSHPPQNISHQHFMSETSPNFACASGGLNSGSGFNYPTFFPTSHPFHDYSRENERCQARENHGKDQKKLIDTVSVTDPVRCLEWSPDSTQPELFAVATVSTLSLLKYQNGKRTLVECAPRFRACCNALAWNRNDSTKIAVGLDKTRMSHSTLVFDISRETNISTHVTPDTGTRIPIEPDSGTAYSQRYYHHQQNRFKGFPQSRTVNYANSKKTEIDRNVSKGLSASTGSGGFLNMRTYGPIRNFNRGLYSQGDPELRNKGSVDHSIQTATDKGSRTHAEKPELFRSDSEISQKEDSGFGRLFRQMSLSETTGALKWFPDQRTVLAVGTYKWLRLYDTRAELKILPQSTIAHSRLVTSINFDHESPWRLATHSTDPIVKIWDTRRLRIPIATIRLDSVPIKLRWAPFRKGLLCIGTMADNGTKAANKLDFFEFGESSLTLGLPSSHKHGKQSSQNDSKTTSEPHRAPCGAVKFQSGDSIESMSWNPKYPHLLAIASERDFEIQAVHHYVPIAIGTTNEIVFARHSRFHTLNPNDEKQRIEAFRSNPHQANSDPNKEYDKDYYNDGMPPPPRSDADISDVMRYRAIRGYGLDLTDNYWVSAELKHQNLIRMWSWLLEIQRDSLEVELGRSKKKEISSTSAGVDSYTGLDDSGHSNGYSDEDYTNNALESEDYTEKFPDISVLPPEGALSLMESQVLESQHRTAPASTNISGTISPSNSGKKKAVLLERGIPVDGKNGGTTPSWFVAHYTSPERDKALALCGWCPLDDKFAIEKLLRRLQQRSLFQRAAALSLFHLDVSRAIRALVEGSQAYSEDAKLNRQQPTCGDGNGKGVRDAQEKADDLRMAAIALSGYGTANNLWRATCQGLLQQLKSPYLRAGLAFLSGEDSPEGFSEVLTQIGMDLRDRVGFALRFLPDEPLRTYLQSCLKECIRGGVLEGILITGVSASNEGTRSLLQSYVDRTSDLQTAALVACYALASDIYALDPKVENRFDGSDKKAKDESAGFFGPVRSPRDSFRIWIETYRSLLDQWRLWTRRARLDVTRALLVSAAQKKRQRIAKKHASDGMDNKAQRKLQETKGTTMGLRNRMQQFGLRTRTLPKVTGTPNDALMLPSSAQKGGGLISPTEPQIYMRCRKCSQALTAPRMKGAQRRATKTSFRSQRIFRSSAKTVLKGGSGAGNRGRIGNGPDGGKQTLTGGARDAAARTSMCPNCHLPLPRCALCLITMNSSTPYAITARKMSSVGLSEDPSNAKAESSIDTARVKKEGNVNDPSSGTIDQHSAYPFGMWFVWCQECRHGGHAAHVYEWFSKHQICPVASCTCRCVTLDI